MASLPRGAPARATATACLTLALAAGGVSAQLAEREIARGDSLQPTDARAALLTYRTALALAPGSGPLLWRLARSEVDVAKRMRDADSEAARDSIYALALDYAERAVAADSADGDARFVLALVLGQQSRTKGGRDRVRYGRLIYEEAARSLELAPDHAGAHHVLGAWHAEVRRLSRVERFFARTFMGGGFMSIAHWDSATVHLGRAIELRPEYVHHRLELAQIHVDLERWAEARAQLETIPGLPDGDVLDAVHREDAARLLEEIRGRAPRPEP